MTFPPHIIEESDAEMQEEVPVPKLGKRLRFDCVHEAYCNKQRVIASFTAIGKQTLVDYMLEYALDPVEIT